MGQSETSRGSEQAKQASRRCKEGSGHGEERSKRVKDNEQSKNSANEATKSQH